MLDLSNLRIRDLSPLKDLKSLSSLNLSLTYVGGELVNDVKDLKGMTNLTFLSLDNSDLKDISPLKGLKGLTLLSLMNTKVEDISPLHDLTNLRTLPRWEPYN